MMKDSADNQLRAKRNKNIDIKNVLENNSQRP